MIETTHKTDYFADTEYTVWNVKNYPRYQFFSEPNHFFQEIITHGVTHKPNYLDSIFSPFLGGEFTEAVGGVYDISNLDRLGTTEVQQVQCVINGINLLTKMEKALEKGEAIDSLLPM